MPNRGPGRAGALPVWLLLVFAGLALGACRSETSIDTAGPTPGAATSTAAVPSVAPTSAPPEATAPPAIPTVALTPAPTVEAPTVAPSPAATADGERVPVGELPPFLADVPAIAGLPPGGAEYRGYIDVVDRDGLIVVSAPEEWTDVDRNNWRFGEVLVGPALSVSPDLIGYVTTWGTPGLFVAASDELPYASTEQFLDTVTFEPDCRYDGRRDYDDGVYVGQVDVYYQCGPEQSAVLQVAAAPPDGSYLIEAQFVAVTERDWQAVAVAIGTFFAEVAPN